MLRKITVKQFKSLVDLDLELGRINLFIGANGSGKSNILEAVGVLGAAANGRVDDEALLRRGVRPGVPTLYKSAFSSDANPKKQWHISLGAESEKNAMYDIAIWNPLGNPNSNWLFKTENLKLNDKPLASRSPRSNRPELNSEQGIAALKTVELEPGDAALALMTQLRGYSIYCPNTPSLRGLVPDVQTREPVGLAGGRLPEAIGELLDAAKKNSELEEILDEVRMLIDWAKDFSATSSVGVPLSPSAARSRQVIQFTDRYMNKGRNRLTGYDASEGALYVLFCAALALHPRSPRCFAVDNVDQALNPRLARRLLAAICRWTKQLNGDRQWLMTAHNPAVLDDLPLDDDEVRLFTVDRNNKGYTEVRRIDVAEAIQKRPDKGWTLSRMWMEGYLGGVPNV
jgi:predicted ATPase